MEIEQVIRDPDNKRIKKMFKIDLTREIQNEFHRSFEQIIYQQSQQISELFGLLDTKHTYGILSEIGSAVLGIDEFNDRMPNSEFFKKHHSQYNRCLDKTHYGLINLSTQLIYALTHMPDNILDQVFIKQTIETIIFLNTTYLSKNPNNILPSQTELLNGLIKQLLEIYNQKLDHALELCNQNDSWWTRATIFLNSALNGANYFEAFSNVLINSVNQAQFKLNIQKNKILIDYKELPFIDDQKSVKIETKNTKVS